MTVADELQPRGAHRCAPWTREQEVDPVGSAGRYDAFLLVESPPPWPDDVSAIPALAAAAGRDPTTRVLAVVPRLDDEAGRVRIVHWWRGAGGRFTGLDHRCEPAAVPTVLDRLVTGPDASAATVVGEAPPDVLVCTHGSRDACCGRWGTLLHAEVAARWEGVRTWRCSHTGGHRFAPTGLTFPDGRGWGFLDAEVLDGIVDRSVEPGALRQHHRGSTAFDPWGQAVDRELFERFGWAWLDHEVTGAATVVTGDGRSARVELVWTAPDGAPGRATAVAAVRRDVPVLVCGRPPEQAAKTSAELEVRHLRVTTGPAVS
jgi:hypothetical protein